MRSEAEREGKIDEMMNSRVETGEILDQLDEALEELDNAKKTIKAVQQAALTKQTLQTIQAIYHTQMEHKKPIISLNNIHFEQLLQLAEITVQK